MMTRKDYVATAAILNKYSYVIPEYSFESMVEDFVQMFKADNERFLADKFEDACWADEEAEEVA